MQQLAGWLAGGSSDRSQPANGLFRLLVCTVVAPPLALVNVIGFDASWFRSCPPEQRQLLEETSDEGLLDRRRRAWRVDTADRRVKDVL